MALDADTLIDRMHLKSQITRWRLLAITAGSALLIVLFGHGTSITGLPINHIAQISIEDVITDDQYQQEMLEELAADTHVKAVLIKIDSPGGTAMGGEELYRGIRAISRKKPVVILMRTLCASAGYMAALGGTHLMAREGTITGSVGVIMQTAEFTDLAKTIGITPITIKSGEQKATPNPMEKLTPAQRDLTQHVVDDFFRFFSGLVKERRKLNPQAWEQIKDGRIFTGRQALEIGLIDQLGGKKEALAWLEKTHHISKEMDIIEIKPDYPEESMFSGFGSKIRQQFFSAINLPLTLDGLVSIWQPAATQ